MFVSWHVFYLTFLSEESRAKWRRDSTRVVARALLLRKKGSPELSKQTSDGIPHSDSSGPVNLTLIC